MKASIRTETLDATQSDNRRIEVATQACAKSVMCQYGTSVNFARFKAFIRRCRVEGAQAQRRDGLAEALRLEPGENNRFVPE